MVYLLQDLLLESANKFPDRQAVVFKDEIITYEELEKITNKLANILFNKKIKKGDRIGIFLNKSIASIISIISILKAGAAYVPIDPLAPVKRLRFIINNCGIDCLITSPDKIEKIDQAFENHLPLKTIILTSDMSENLKSKLRARLIPWQAVLSMNDQSLHSIKPIDSDIAYILYTSGSTGDPKGVMISHLNSLTFVNMACEFFQIQKEDILSNLSPLHSDMSIFDIFTAIKAGAAIAIVPESASIFPIKLAESIQDNKISVWNSVPSALSLLAADENLDKFDFSSLRLILFAGEVFPLKYLRRLKKFIPAASFYNMYGQTEANSSLYYRVEQMPSDDTGTIPIGTEFPNFEVFALDENNRKINKPGEKGELYIRGSSVALGYWGEAEKTETSFVKNPLSSNVQETIYKTGDLVTIDTDGNYLFLGRKDHMIKSRGYRIELGEIETALASHEQVKNVVVIPIPDELIGNRIAAIIVPLNNDIIKKEDIIAYCSQRLPKYMIPEIVDFRDSLPMTSSGKIDRKLLASKLSLEPLIF